MPRVWQGLMYTQDGIVILGAVSRDAGEGPWSAWRLQHDRDNELLGDWFATAEKAQRAVEAACGAE